MAHICIRIEDQVEDREVVQEITMAVDPLGRQFVDLRRRWITFYE